MADSRIVTVLAADDRFSRPLAATVRSIVSRLSPGRELDMYLCDMGITGQNREKIAGGRGPPRGPRPLGVDAGERGRASPRDHAGTGITRAAYARLFIPWALPREMDRVLYLDCDLIVRRCLGELFRHAHGRFRRYGGGRRGLSLCLLALRRALLVAVWPPGRRCQLQLRCAPLNLPVWREEDIAGAAVKYLTDGRHQFLVDQEAINAVLPGRIGQVDPRWNQQTEHFVQPSYRVTLPFDGQQVNELRQGPVDRAFHHPVKAWSYGCTHPFRMNGSRTWTRPRTGDGGPPAGAYLAGQARRLLDRVKDELRPRSG